jgi:hypothetical protein
VTELVPVAEDEVERAAEALAVLDRPLPEEVVARELEELPMDPVDASDAVDPGATHWAWALQIWPLAQSESTEHWTTQRPSVQPPTGHWLSLVQAVDVVDPHAAPVQPASFAGVLRGGELEHATIRTRGIPAQRIRWFLMVTPVPRQEGGRHPSVDLVSQKGILTRTTPRTFPSIAAASRTTVS